jgi:hypothetical protein
MKINQARPTNNVAGDEKRRFNTISVVHLANGTWPTLAKHIKAVLGKTTLRIDVKILPDGGFPTLTCEIPRNENIDLDIFIYIKIYE